jgi:diguanylate cyclase (GGDEF)-like protein
MRALPHKKSWLRASRTEWIAATICAALVLAAGARLVVLSMQHQAEQAQRRAQAQVDQSARALESQLSELVRIAQQRAALAAQTPASADERTALQALPPMNGSFYLLADGSIVGASVADRQSADSIAAQWPASERTMAAGTAAARLRPPVRQGSEWLIALATPLATSAPTATAASAQSDWAVAYRPLGALLLGARLDRVSRAGYDFELSSADRSVGRATVLATSATALLPQPVIGRIPLPQTRTGAANAWLLAMRPRAGWFPATTLVVDASLVILVTWLVALGVRDATRHIVHLREALAVSRRRLQRSQHRLVQEIELRERLQKSFDHAHDHDPFTGLPNRHYFVGQLDRALRLMRTHSGHHAAVLLIGVDRFKVITDTLGHTAGDELMVQITTLFDQTLSERDHVLSRWVGDELALLLIDVPDGEALLETARALQRALQTPIDLRRHHVVVATSIGATFVESGLQRAEEVMRQADIALTSARNKGGSSLISYSSAMQAHLLQLVSLEGDLHTALQREEFRLLFQPIVDLHGHRIVGLEALLRWMHPVEGLLRPDRFLSFAEEAGLIVPITRWIILRACQLAAEWRRRLPPATTFYISINLSPAALLDPALSEHVEHALEVTNTPPSGLKFELTERGLINSVGAARDALDRLHAIGIELMLDDFGTGYSSLSHLQLFPFDYIKIDAPFDSRTGTERGSQALVRAMAQMAAALGLKTIAEIVETTAAVDTLRAIGCEFAQGNAFCAPVEAEQAMQRLRGQVLEPIDERELDDDSPTLILPIIREHATL